MRLSGDETGDDTGEGGTFPVFSLTAGCWEGSGGMSATITREKKANHAVRAGATGNAADETWEKASGQIKHPLDWTQTARREDKMKETTGNTQHTNP